VIDPEALVAKHGSDPVRYFLLREGSFGQDWDFTDTAFQGRYNSDLANDLGNLVSRTLTMVTNYCDGKVPARGALSTTLPVADILARYEACDFVGALTEIWRVVTSVNQAIVNFAPWVVAKEPTRRAELEHFLYAQMDLLRQIIVLVSPVIPTAAERIFKMMGLEPHTLGPADLEWGVLESGRPLGTVEPVFPRLTTDKEKPKVSDQPTPPATAPAPATAASGLVDINEFAKIELKVAKVVSAEKVEGATKLLKLQIDLGGETRQIVSGIAEAYTPEALVGKTIAVVANLKPAKIRGVESNGMLLAASLDGKPVLCTFDADVPPGTRIK
jgi:methionyl-tRNA synthetase